MNIISYRGPGMAGGVSSALALLWSRQLQSDSTWWHLTGNTMQATDDIGRKARDLSILPAAVIEGHYRYCNEFLWPIMHDLPEYATYKADDHKLYSAANRIIARAITADSSQTGQPAPVFVQDYQWAVLPELLERVNIPSLLFWHIPWPVHVAPEHVRPLTQIARGLVSAGVLGFHTHEYARNFLQFVHQHLSGVHVNFSTCTVTRGTGQNHALPWTLGAAPAIGGRTTRVITAPLGIDPLFWSSSAAIPQIRLHGTEFNCLHSGKPYILSVDRADYTKGVVHRLRSIDRFFQLNPDMRGKINFVQICGRTRPGLAAFDKYWEQCNAEEEALQSKWRLDDWSPVTRVDKPCTGAELSVIYRDAEVMLVNPVRDGLNLTAKEFVASQIRRPGKLALSDGAGAWHEMGDHALRLDPLDYDQMASTIKIALAMSKNEAGKRIEKLNERLRGNTLTDWWTSIAAQIEDSAITATQLTAQ
jgi:trehalose-6-phosphate synthase